MSCLSHVVVDHGRGKSKNQLTFLPTITGPRRSRSMAPLARRRWRPRQGFLQGWLRAADEQEGGFVDSLAQVCLVQFALSLSVFRSCVVVPIHSMPLSSLSCFVPHGPPACPTTNLLVSYIHPSVAPSYPSSYTPASTQLSTFLSE